MCGGVHLSEPCSQTENIFFFYTTNSYKSYSYLAQHGDHGYHNQRNSSQLGTQVLLSIPLLTQSLFTFGWLWSYTLAEIVSCFGFFLYQGHSTASKRDHRYVLNVHWIVLILFTISLIYCNSHQASTWEINSTFIWGNTETSGRCLIILTINEVMERWDTFLASSFNNQSLTQQRL